MNATSHHKATEGRNIHYEVMLQSYGKAIDAGLLHLSSLADVSQSDIDYCHSLRADLLAWIYSELNNTEPTLDTEQTAGWRWRPKMDTNQLRIGFLTLHENKSVPIHDHPGSSGLLVILKGRLLVQQFQRSDSNSSTRRMIKLIQTEEHEAGPGEFAIISPSAGNIHSIRACMGPCIVLDVLLSPYSEKQRGWYMPIDDRSHDQKLVRTIRVSRLR